MLVFRPCCWPSGSSRPGCRRVGQPRSIPSNPCAMNDLKFAFRQLLKNPGFAIVAVVTLGLGIGACTAIFSLINAVLLRPLPFQDVQRLVWIENIYPGDLSGRTIRMDNFIDWRAYQQSFEELAAYYAF